jgi:hypothetical protein
MKFQHVYPGQGDSLACSGSYIKLPFLGWDKNYYVIFVKEDSTMLVRDPPARKTEFKLAA